MDVSFAVMRPRHTQIDFRGIPVAGWSVSYPGNGPLPRFEFRCDAATFAPLLVVFETADGQTFYAPLDMRRLRTHPNDVLPERFRKNHAGRFHFEADLFRECWSKVSGMGEVLGAVAA